MARGRGIVETNDERRPGRPGLFGRDNRRRTEQSRSQSGRARLPRRGYRFIAPVSGAAGSSGVPGAAGVAGMIRSAGSKSALGVGPGGTGASPARVAVLPFTNLSGDGGQQYFSDSLTEG